MAFQPIQFFVGRGIIARQGVPQDEATRLALVPGLLELPLVSAVLLSTAIGRSRAPAAAAAEPAPEAFVKVPDVTTKGFDRAKSQLENVGLVATKRDVVVDDKNEDGKVVHQDPKGGEVVSSGTIVMLDVGKLAQPAPAPAQPAPAPAPAPPP
jgi:PASTA domain